MNIRKLLFIFIILCVCSSISLAQTCPYFQTDVDYQGYDINYSFVSSVIACCNLCASVAICNAFTYIQSSQACWLKYSVGTPTDVQGRVSGIVSSRTLASTVSPVTFTITTTAASTLASSTNSGEATTRTYGCFIENNINYYGFDFLARYTPTASDCCNLCGQTDTCVVWAFLTDVKYCYLKNSVPPLSQRQNYTNMISGIVTLR